jgi:hypothetical protein
MPVRCDLHVNGGHRRAVLSLKPAETWDHLTLRLATLVLFWGLDMKPELSAKHPALEAFDFLPDAVGFNEAGEIALWVECGNVTKNKLDKITRRLPGARLVVLKETLDEARRLRRDAADALARGERIEIWAWPPGAFALWRDAVADVVEVYGEVEDRSLNLVINNVPLAVDLACA